MLIQLDQISEENKNKYSNLTKEEWEAIEKLNKFQKEGNIVIQPADKNGGICILDRIDYIEEANRQLNDTLKDENGQESNYYGKSNEKAIQDQYKEIKKIIQEGVNSEYFSQNKLLPSEPKAVIYIFCQKFTKKFKLFLKDNCNLWFKHTGSSQVF